MKINKLKNIKERVAKFEYGLGQADYDVRYLLRLLDKKDKEIVELKKELKELENATEYYR